VSIQSLLDRLEEVPLDKRPSDEMRLDYAKLCEWFVVQSEVSSGARKDSSDKYSKYSHGGRKGN